MGFSMQQFTFFFLSSINSCVKCYLQVNHFRKVNRIHVIGTDIPDPISNFESLQQNYTISERLYKNIMNECYDKPTPIQMQAIPLMMTVSIHLFL